VLRAGADGSHRARHDVLASLPVDVELLVLDVELDEGQPGVEPVLAVQRARIDARIRRALHVARLQSAVLEHALAVAAGHDLAATVRVELRMLAVPEIHLELLLGARVEAKVRLIGEIVRVEDHSHEARLADERLRLLGLAAIDARVLAIAHLGFRVAVYDLKQWPRRAMYNMRRNDRCAGHIVRVYRNALLR